MTANIVKISLNTSSYADKYCYNNALFTIFATKDIQLTGIPTINLQLKHQRKADIDATRGSFELPTNSKTAPA